jgi:uncharacterized protein (DUF488 family)
MNAGIEKTLQIFTVGHSNLSFEQFSSLLKEHEIGLVADIRRYPSSRKFPHFNRPVLSELLAAENIDYLWLESLGGRRHIDKDSKSINVGLESIGFRNYADYMATDEFHKAVDELIKAAAQLRTSVMCAEKLYWKCHRRILSDYLTARQITVIHILEPDKISEHKLTHGAAITETGVIYPLPETGDSQRTLFDLESEADMG